MHGGDYHPISDMHLKSGDDNCHDAFPASLAGTMLSMMIAVMMRMMTMRKIKSIIVASAASPAMTMINVTTETEMMKMVKSIIVASVASPMRLHDKYHRSIPCISNNG